MQQPSQAIRAKIIRQAKKDGLISGPECSAWLGELAPRRGFWASLSAFFAPSNGRYVDQRGVVAGGDVAGGDIIKVEAGKPMAGKTRCGHCGATR